MSRSDPPVKNQDTCPLPQADSRTGLKAMRALWQTRSPLGALSVMQQEIGNAFQIKLGSFAPAVFAGPDYNRRLYVTGRDQLNWRSAQDPVTKLLRRGVLVVDGELHDSLRAQMDPTLHRTAVLPHIEAMRNYTDMITAEWETGQVYNMLDEMRRIALLILIGTLFGVNFRPDLDRLWPSILSMLAYIGPGAWIVWPDAPRPGYARAIEQVDDYLYQIIRDRRAELNHDRVAGVESAADPAADLLTNLIQSGLNDDLIRDQLLTMLIAGHDTSTALFAWTLYLLGSHSAALAQAQAEVDAVLHGEPPGLDHQNQMPYLDWVVKEALRLYPPIHVGNRRTQDDMQVGDYCVPAGRRVMLSIYLSHRDPAVWSDPEAFRPERFDRRQEEPPPAFAYVPFGAGPRNCIGAIYATIEARVVLARLLQHFKFELVDSDVHTHMGATLEPRPGVFMRVWKRQ